MTIERKPMTADDFILVMALNKNYYPEFDVLPDEQKREIADVHLQAGTAESFFDDGELIGVGGIHWIGVGESWMVCLPKMRDDRKFTLLREAKKVFEQTRDKLNLWRIFATSRISGNFLKHMGFEKNDTCSVWTRWQK